jgi:hypothetical protein
MAGTSPIHGKADKHRSDNDDDAVLGSLSKGDIQKMTAPQGKYDRAVPLNQEIE